MKLKLPVFALLLCLLSWGCIDEIKLDVDGGTEQIVVDGLIADSLQVYEIKVNLSSIVGSGKEYVHEPVNGAKVQVFDNVGNSFEFLETDPGVYTKEMQGEPGRSYYVEVKTTDGKTIKSVPALLNKAPKISDVTSAVLKRQEYSSSGTLVDKFDLELRVNTNIEGLDTLPYLRWDVKGEYEFKEWYPMALNPKTCYIKDRIGFNKLHVFDTHDLIGKDIKDELFFTMTYDYRFAYNYCFHALQYAINKAEFKYWESVSDIIDIDGSLFDPPPGTVKGNLYYENDPSALVLGYFSVAGVSYQREITNSSDQGVATEPKCMTFRPQGRPRECNDCLLLFQSTLEEPSYWP